LVFSFFGLLKLYQAKDFLNFYIFLELYGLSFYILLGFKRQSKTAIEAAFKYFIVGASSSCLILYGISTFYCFSGILSFQGIKYYLWGNYYLDHFFYNIFSIGFIFILLGFMVKLGVFPFNF
jgi:NADH-quinone oxidoreductase subunit N